MIEKDKNIENTFNMMEASINSILNVAKSLDNSTVLDNVSIEINKIIEKAREQIIENEDIKEKVPSSTIKKTTKKLDTKKIKKEKKEDASYIPQYHPDNTPPKKVTPLL